VFRATVTVSDLNFLWYIGYDAIPQKVQVTVTVTVALNPGMMIYHKKFRSLTVTVALNPGMMKYHKKFGSL
jgi:hypothetical protein